MACCKCCCGGEDCTEGQEGKCCCGGSSGTCCDVGEYCCSGVCSAEPCDSTYPCDCFGSWPTSLSLDITGLEDYFITGQGKCNCPADGYAAGWNQTVVLDYEGVVTVAGCPSLPGGANYKNRTFADGNTVTVNDNTEPYGYAVYRGSMTNDTCDEYGVEVLLWQEDGQCLVLAVIDRLATGTPTICEPWVEATLTCNWWVLTGTFDEGCTNADLTVDDSYYGGSGTAPHATLEPL